MALSGDDIARLKNQYGRERDRYTKMASKVRSLCEKAFSEHKVRAVVTARAKSVASVQKKLARKAKDLDSTSFDGGFNPEFLDVSGARVMLYEYERDVDQVTALIQELFQLEDNPRYRREHGSGQTRCYQARHRVVKLRSETIESDGELENLASVLCEIQVVSLVKHAWNELEHDIKYKDPEGLGEPDREQHAWLDALWDTLQAAQTAASHLSRVTEDKRARRRAQERPLDDADDLRLALGQLLGRPPRGNLEALFNTLNGTLRVVSGASLSELGVCEDWVAEGRQTAASAGVNAPDDVESILTQLFGIMRADLEEMTNDGPLADPPLARLIAKLVDHDQSGGAP